MLQSSVRCVSPWQLCRRQFHSTADTWAMHAEAVGPKGLYDRARHLCKVVPQPQGLGDLAHPLLRHRRQPPQHIFALLQLLPVLKQALLAQELRRANAIITALSTYAALPALSRKPLHLQDLLHVLLLAR